MCGKEEKRVRLRRIIYLFFYIYVYLGLIIYPNYTGYHTKDVITVFSFTFGFDVLRIFVLKLPFQVTCRL